MSIKRLLTVLVTGAAGNLGGKLARYLSEASWCERLILLDRKPPQIDAGAAAKAETIVSDLSDTDRPNWRDAVRGADAIVHFASANPAADCTWQQATASFDMTARLLHEAMRHQCRFVFASSNHVMGGYKECKHLPAGALSPATEPLPGTRLRRGSRWTTGTAYAVTKLMGERSATVAAVASNGMLTAVSLRIGWCGPGTNAAEEITLPSYGSTPHLVRARDHDLWWYRSMWLGDRDFHQLCERAVLASEVDWPLPAIVVNGMSNNADMPWGLESGRSTIGYDPSAPSVSPTAVRPQL